MSKFHTIKEYSCGGGFCLTKNFYLIKVFNLFQQKLIKIFLKLCLKLYKREAKKFS